ncbi:MAG: ABC transporter ATP-binding protein [Clostridiales bacterium]|nr:ABC transporter ATP-binding protein [Clostridiales bacterium]
MSNQHGSTTKKHHDEKIDFEKSLKEIEGLFGSSKTTSKKQGFISKLLKKDTKPIVISTILYIFQSLPVYMVPLLTSNIIDLITLRPENYVMQIIINVVIILISLFLNVPFTCLRGRVVNNMIRTTTAKVKSTLIRKLQRLSITFHKEIEEGVLQSKFLRDMENVENYYRLFVNSLLVNILTAIISIAIAAVKNPIVLLFFIIAIPTNVIIVKLLRKKIGAQSSIFRKENENLSAKITTSIQMMAVTKAHGLLSQEATSVDQKIETATQAGLKLDKTNMFFGAILWVASQTISIICFCFCVYLAIKNIITVGDVVLFQSLFASISSSILSITSIIPNLVSGAEAVRSLSEIMQADELEHDDGKLPVPGIKGNFEFHNVCYQYPKTDKAVIRDFNLKVNAGQTVAFVGSSGSGKSTIINLIIGLLSPVSGDIIVDGKNLRDLPMQTYRKFISVVPQNTILFSGTIKENITYGLSHYSEQEFQKAVEDAAINEFLSILPNGLNTMVGEHGDKLSGGQKQRISIARALIRKPNILILDEATSALDNISELHIQKAIENASKDRTTFIVAHRLSTIRNADLIVVMENGKIVETGSYQELIKLNGKFAELERLSTFTGE